MAGLLGLRDDETRELEQDVAATLGDDGQQASAAYARIHGAVEVLLERGRRQPGADLTSRLLAHPARLTDEEAVQDLIALLAAGVRPTADWIGNTLRLMLTDDRFAVSLSGGRRSVGQALTEVLWTDGPAQNVVGRWAAQDTQLGGRHIRRGDCLVLGLAAANADPQVCPYPHAGAAAAGAAAAAGNQAHLSFSHGEHGCPAPAPERAEAVATATVEVLLDRLPDLRLACAPESLTWRPSLWSRGPAALPVEFTPAAPGPRG
jgi:cytochrome P450